MSEPATTETVIAVLNEKFSALEQKLDRVTNDHEVRLRRLEAWSYGIPVAVLTSFGGVVAALIYALNH